MLSPYEWEAIYLSLKVSSVAVIFSLPLGILMAWYWFAVIFLEKHCSTYHSSPGIAASGSGYLLLIVW